MPPAPATVSAGASAGGWPQDDLIAGALQRYGNAAARFPPLVSASPRRAPAGGGAPAARLAGRYPGLYYGRVAGIAADEAKLAAERQHRPGWSRARRRAMRRQAAAARHPDQLLHHPADPDAAARCQASAITSANSAGARSSASLHVARATPDQHLPPAQHQRRRRAPRRARSPPVVRRSEVLALSDAESRRRASRLWRDSGGPGRSGRRASISMVVAPRSARSVTDCPTMWLEGLGQVLGRGCGAPCSGNRT